jgi:hypothetical protein
LKKNNAPKEEINAAVEKLKQVKAALDEKVFVLFGLFLTIGLDKIIETSVHKSRVPS